MPGLDDQALQQWQSHERDISERTAYEAETNPQRNIFHRFFVLVNFITIMAALLMGIGQFIGMALLEDDPVQYVVRVYVLLLCLLVIFNELEWTFLTRDSALLRIWISRGIIYSFIGVLGIEQNLTQVADKHLDYIGRDQAIMFMKVVAWIMVGTGLLYTIMGLLCLQIVANKSRAGYAERVERSKEFKKQHQQQRGQQRGQQRALPTIHDQPDEEPFSAGETV